MSSSIDQFKLKPLTLAIRRETQHKGGFLGKVLRVVVPIAIPFIAPAILPVSGIFGKLALNMGMGALTSKLTGGNPLTGALLAGAGTVASQAIGGLKNLPKTGGGTISTATNAANPSGFQFMGGLGQTGRDAAASLAQSGIPGISHTIDTATGQLVGTTGFNQNLSNVAFNDLGNVVTDAAGNVLSDTTSNLVTDAAGNVVNKGNLLATGNVKPRPTQFFQQHPGVDTTGLNLSNVRTTNIDPRIAANLRDAPTISNTQTTQRNPDNALLKNQPRVDTTTNRVLTGTQGSGATHGTDFLSRMQRGAKRIFGKAADNLIQNPNRLMAVLTGLASDNLTDLTDEEKQMIADQKRRLAELEKSDKVAHAQQQAIFNDLLSEVRSFDPNTIARRSATDEAIRLAKLKQQTLRNVNPRRDDESAFIARQFDIQAGRDSSLAFRDAFDRAQNTKTSGLFNLSQMVPKLDARGFDAGDKLAKLEDTAEKNRIARAKTTAEFGGALFDFDSPLKKEEEEEVPA